MCSHTPSPPQAHRDVPGIGRGVGFATQDTRRSTGRRVPLAPGKSQSAIGRGAPKRAARVLRRVEMRVQVTEDSETAERSTLSRFLTRCKDPASGALNIVLLVSALGAGFIAGVKWAASSEVEPLRRELAQARDTTKSELAGLQNQVRTISENGERIARVETALAGTRERVNRLHTQVTKNTDGITELKVRGTPE